MPPDGAQAGENQNQNNERKQDNRSTLLTAHSSGRESHIRAILPSRLRDDALKRARVDRDARCRGLRYDVRLGHCP